MADLVRDVREQAAIAKTSLTARQLVLMIAGRLELYGDLAIGVRSDFLLKAAVMLKAPE